MQEHEEHPTQNAQSGSQDAQHTQQHAQDAQHAQPADGTQPIRHEHKVLSFVRRSGRLDARLQRAWDTYAGTYLLPLNAAEGSLDIRDDWRLTREWIHDTWGNAHPLVIEIGTGQGENIVAAAAQHPQTNYLALEVYDPGVAHTMLRAGKQHLNNLRIAQINAPELFAKADAATVDEVWTFFPDPWPKMKHHKRRIVQPALAEAIHRALVAGGLWRIATDIEDYALHVHEVMDGRDDFENIGEITVSLPTGHVGKGNADLALDMPHADFAESSRFEGRVLTNFEKKGLEAGRVIHDFTYRSR